MNIYKKIQNNSLHRKKSCYNKICNTSQVQSRFVAFRNTSKDLLNIVKL